MVNGRVTLHTFIHTHIGIGALGVKSPKVCKGAQYSSIIRLESKLLLTLNLLEHSSKLSRLYIYICIHLQHISICTLVGIY